MDSSLEKSPESSEGKFEFGEQIGIMCRSLGEIKSSAESMAKMDRNYTDRIREGLSDVRRLDREMDAPGRYKTFDEIREGIGNVRRGVEKELSRGFTQNQNKEEMNEDEIGELLSKVTAENSEEVAAKLNLVRKKLSDYCNGIEEDREIKHSARNSIAARAEEALENRIIGKARAEEEGKHVKDDRLTTMARKYVQKLFYLRDAAATLNSKASEYEEAGLEVIKDRFKIFNRAVADVLDQLEQNKE